MSANPDPAVFFLQVVKYQFYLIYVGSRKSRMNAQAMFFRGQGKYRYLGIVMTLVCCPVMYCWFRLFQCRSGSFFCISATYFFLLIILQCVTCITNHICRIFFCHRFLRISNEFIQVTVPWILPSTHPQSKQLPYCAIYLQWEHF